MICLSKHVLPKEWVETLGLIQTAFPNSVIAGGCIRDFLLGREPKDIDVFANVPPNMDAKSVSETLKGLLNAPTRIVINEEFANYGNGFDNVRLAIEIEIERGSLPIQFIALKGHVSRQSVCDRIDFGLCRVAFDGQTVFLTDDFLRDVADKTMTLIRCDSDAQRARSMRRFDRLREKYQDYRLVEEF